MSHNKNKCVKQCIVPGNRQIPETRIRSRQVVVAKNPDEYYSMHPTWGFSSCDTEQWPLCQEYAGTSFWNLILPRMKHLETMTWAEILVKDNKHNHSISTESLNKVAQDRLKAKYVEQDAVISLTLDATSRLYGYMNGSTFYILWFDSHHGDNDSCVCRSRLKHS